MTKKLNILYVEDDLDTIESMNLFLKTSFNKTFICTNGQEALNVYTENMDNIDLILTDIDLPFMDGVKLIKEIRKSNDQIPIFAISGLTDIEDEIKELGINDFFKKPILDIFKIKYTIDRYF